MRIDLMRKGLGWGGSALVVEYGHGIQHALYALVSNSESSGIQGPSSSYKYANRFNTFVTE